LYIFEIYIFTGDTAYWNQRDIKNISTDLMSGTR